jgi:hypothetical protein
MENYNRGQSYFPTFSKLIKLIKWYCIALDRLPALVGQLSFYLVMEFMFAVFALTGIVHFTDRFLLTFPFLGIFFTVFVYPDVTFIIFLTTIFFISLALNKIILVFSPDIRTSRTKLLVTSLIIGLLSFWPANILGLYIMNLFTIQ